MELAVGTNIIVDSGGGQVRVVARVSKEVRVDGSALQTKVFG